MKMLRELTPVLRLFHAERGAQLWAGAALAAATSLVGMLLLGLSGWFITATAIAGASAATAWAFDVFAPSAGIRLLALGRSGSRYAERLVTHDATLAVLSALRERLFRGWARPDAARRLMLRPAKLLFRLTADIDALDAAYLRVWVPLGTAIAAASAAGLALLVIDGRLALAVTAWLLLAGLGLAWVVARAAQRPARRRAYAMEALRARTVDLVAGQTELAMAGRLDAQRSAMAVADAHLARADDALNQRETRAVFGFGAIGSAALCATLLAVAALVEEHSIGVPVAALAVLLVLSAAEPFTALRRGALELGRTVLAARRLAPHRQPAGHPGDENPAPHPDASVVRLDHVFAHPAGVDGGPPVLRDIGLRIAAGERVALVGPSGAGKSTLLALLAGDLTAQSGVVLAPRCSLLTQRTELFQDSLRDNLRLADPLATDLRLGQALHAAGLADDVQRLPAGLSTLLGEGGLGLSGGQARRLALARLLLRDVPLWLLDEPTEGLDAATARDVLARLAHLAEEAMGKPRRTLVFATHIRREAALADRLVCLQQGRIVADLRRGDAGFDAALRRLRPD
ncbi:MAG: transporter ATP-binding protein [Rhodoferax sp.]|nr:transporter ATP-binding protein [Rhodoferax sp.]